MADSTASVILPGMSSRVSSRPKQVAPATMISRVAEVTAETDRDLLDLTQLHGSVDEQLHDKGVDAGHDRGLVGGEGPGKNPAENDHRQHQRPEPLLEDGQNLAQSWEPACGRFPFSCGNKDRNKGRSANMISTPGTNPVRKSPSKDTLLIMV